VAYQKLLKDEIKNLRLLTPGLEAAEYKARAEKKLKQRASETEAGGKKKKTQAKKPPAKRGKKEAEENESA